MNPVLPHIASDLAVNMTHAEHTALVSSLKEIWGKDFIRLYAECLAGVKKPGRGKSQKSLNLIDAAYEILEEIQPATVRAVCYRLFVLKMITSMSKGETSKVSKQLTWAREEGHIPWEWIVDEARRPETIPQWDEPQSIIEAACRQYRKNNWTAQANRVEVWSEKGTVRGTLAPVLDKYGVTFRVMHGYGSATVLHDIAEETAGNEKPLTVLYVGDWDPSGMNMSEVDLPARLNRYGGSATIIRVALDESDVGPGTRLPSFEAETKRGDSRHAWFVNVYGERCWELDALPPPDLRERVEAGIVGRLDQDAWANDLRVEMAERESMQTILQTWKSISSQVRRASRMSAIDTLLSLLGSPRPSRETVTYSLVRIFAALHRLGDCDPTTRDNVICDELDLERDYLRGGR